MPVNFTPEMKGYSGQGAFRFWCQAVLPLVYDDSLSYMELLNKMVIYLNNTISDVAAMEDNVEGLYNAYNELQACYNELEKFVNDYFDNLDVQEEINNKLDAMVTDGTMDALIEPFVNDGIGSAVTSWLNEYVDPVGSAVVVDNSLTIEGAAADAKVTGARTLKYASVSAPFGLSDMARNSYVYTRSQNFNDCPSDIPNDTFICVVRRNANEAGNVSSVFVITMVADEPDVYVARFSETASFGEWTKLANDKNVIHYFNPHNETFSAASMPVNTYTYCNVSLFTDSPSQLTSNYAVHIEKRATNAAGSLCTLVCYTPAQEGTLPLMFYASVRTSGGTTTFSGWSQTDYMTCNVPSTETFGLSDLPRSSYTYSVASRFTDCPEGVPSDSRIIIERRNINIAGNVSYLRLQTTDNPAQVYVAYYSETSTFRGWTKIAIEEEINFLKENIIGETYNIFDKDKAEFINGYFSQSGRTITGSNYTNIFYIPIKPNTNYIYSYNQTSYASNIGTSVDIPEVGDTLDAVDLPDVVQVPGNGRSYKHFITGDTAAYLIVYYYNQSHDSLTKEQLLSEIMITEGSDYKIPFDEHYSAKIEKITQLPIDTYGIFGIKFRRNVNIPRVERIYNASGLTYRQQVGETIQKSDFDNAFPWCEMRECNVVVDENGNKTITYNGETGFTRNANTFIEIPAFYFKRTLVNDVEEWCVSGKPFSGADLEPWFYDENGNPVKYRYIGKYEGSSGNGGVSVSGVLPATKISFADCKTLCNNYNINIMDIYGYFAISHLMAIEYGDLNAQAINMGISYMAYAYNEADWIHPVNTGTGNTVTWVHSSSDLRLTYLNVGDTIYLSETSSSDTSNPRTITAINIPNDTTVQVTFSGSAYNITSSTYAFPAFQPTGRTDNMTYNCGRPVQNAMLSPFQYRGIENPYGNVWERADNIIWTKATEKFTIHGVETKFTAPLQTATGSDTTTGGWIKTLGCDRDMPWATLPETVGGGNLKNRYISDEWNSGTSDVAIIAVSGGWDHQSLNGAFIARGISENSTAWLYGFRAMI